MRDVFNSYGRKESLTFATKLFKKLEVAGHITWFEYPKDANFQQSIDYGVRLEYNSISV